MAAGDKLLLDSDLTDKLLLDSDLTDVLLLQEAAVGGVTEVPLGHQRLDNQFAVIAASRLNGVLQ